MMKKRMKLHSKVRTLILFASLVVALSGVHILSAQAACDAGVDVAQGEMLYAAGSYEEAALAFHCVVEADQLNYEAWISYDKALLMSGRYLDLFLGNNYLVLSTEEHLSDEVAEMTQAAAVNPDDLHTAKMLAFFAQTVSYVRPDLEADAAMATDRYLELAPDDPFANYLKGYWLVTAESIESAQQFYDRALELAPNNPHIVGLVGSDLDTYAGQTERGLALVNQALELAPDKCSAPPVSQFHLRLLDWRYGWLLRGNRACA